MSMYMSEEICEGCEHAVFHDCCKRFCHCKENNESYRKHTDGTCLFKKVAAQKTAEGTAQVTTAAATPCHEHIMSMAAWNDNQRHCATCGKVY